ncbi:hypothetical protein GCM10028808_73390 [Spirosoma migulaei]
MDLISSLIDVAAQEQVRKIDDLLLDRLRQHIPDITKQNISEYAHRLTSVSVEGSEYPKRLYLDSTILIFEQLEPEMNESFDEKGIFTVTMTQPFR